MLWSYPNILFLLKPSPIHLSIHQWACLQQWLLWCFNGDFLFPSFFLHYSNSLKFFYREELYLLSHFFTYSIIYLYQYGLMGNYFSLCIIIHCYHDLFYCQIVLVSDIGISRVGSCVPSFFEHFLTFQNHNIFRAHLVYYSIFLIISP